MLKYFEYSVKFYANIIQEIFKMFLWFNVYKIVTYIRFKTLNINMYFMNQKEGDYLYSW